ncbi:MAG TPA: glycosyltransferase [Acidobacteriaceae bacterium]|nr:glycosyltransferase [Acidobacteriaceae bacterium]
MPELSVVMPAYREAGALSQLLPSLVQALNQLETSYEIVVADSMEPLDDTAAVCARYGVRHLHRTGGNTYGDAVRSGIRAAEGKYVLLMDADGSHNPNDIEKLWRIRDRTDIVIGSRYVAGGATENPFFLIFLSRVLNYMYELVFRLPVRDISNSFRLYRGDELRSLELVSNNFEIVEEILIRLVCGSIAATVAEAPVTFEKRKAGESKRNLPAFMLSYVASIRRLRKFRALELGKRGK